MLCTCTCNVHAMYMQCICFEKCEFWLDLGMREGISVSVLGDYSEEEEGEEEEEEARGEGGRVEEVLRYSYSRISDQNYICCPW